MRTRLILVWLYVFPNYLGICSYKALLSGTLCKPLCNLTYLLWAQRAVISFTFLMLPSCTIIKKAHRQSVVSEHYRKGDSEALHTFFFPVVLFHLAPITSMLFTQCSKVMPKLVLSLISRHRIMRATEKRGIY